MPTKRKNKSKSENERVAKQSKTDKSKIQQTGQNSDVPKVSKRAQDNGTPATAKKDATAYTKPTLLYQLGGLEPLIEGVEQRPLSIGATGAVAVSKKGELWLTDKTVREEIKVFDLNGKLLRKIKIGDFEVDGLGVSEKGDFALMSYDKTEFNNWICMVYLYSSDGTLKHTFAGPTGDVWYGNAFILETAASEWAITRKHGIRFCDNEGNTVREVGRDPYGNYFGRGDQEYDKPASLGVSSSGEMYVCDTGNCRLRALDPEGNFLFNFGVMGTRRQQFLSPVAVCVDKNDNLLILDNGINRISVFSNRGKHIQQLLTKEDGLNQHNYMAISTDNRLVCAQQGYDRGILVYQM